MYRPATAPPFTPTLEGVAQVFQILAFDGGEAIGQPYPRLFQQRNAAFCEECQPCKDGHCER